MHCFSSSNVVQQLKDMAFPRALLIAMLGRLLFLLYTGGLGGPIWDRKKITFTALGHSHFPEYTARGDYLYVSAGYGGDRLVIYDSHTLKKVKSVSMEVPAGVFSHLRARTVVVGLESVPRASRGFWESGSGTNRTDLTK